jgi:AcrR family transcriptional regulator
MTRRYELKQRAQRQADTRRRILEATVALHAERGLVATQVTDVAQRAGVDRVTVYRHFPDPASLFKACAAHYYQAHPPPDPTAWAAIADPEARLRHGLGEVYAYWADNTAMAANVLRDAQVLPALRAILEGGLLRNLDQARRVLTEPIDVRGRRRQRVDAAARAAIDLHTWRALAPLGDAEAADLAAGLIELAAKTHSTR